MKASWIVTAILPFLGSVYAQGGGGWCDTENGLCFQGIQKRAIAIVSNGTAEPYDLWIGAAFPEDTTRNEFVGEILASNNGQWAGYDLGSSMSNQLLLLVWTNANQFVYSSRMASTYANPTLYEGPTITQLPSSTINSTHWKFVFRCQNCTSWVGRAPNNTPGGIGTDSTVQGFGICLASSGSSCVDNPGAADSVISQHTEFGLWGAEIARTPHYDDEYLTGYGTTPSTPTGTGPTPTTTVPPTTTAIPTPYDYIVVGAGAAGIVVADRLSEAGKKVLLLERGSPSTKETGGTREVPEWAKDTGLTRFDIPGLFENMFGSDNPWWWCSDMTVFGGCLVGGGTVINGMLYWPPPDYEFSSQYGWPYEWTVPGPWINRMLARLPSSVTPSADSKFYLDQVYTLLSSHFKKKGYRETTINSNRNLKDNVFGHPAYNFKNGIRSGVTHTYLQTAKARKNFKLLTDTYAQAVVRNGSTITGVQTNNYNDLPYGLATLTPKGRVVLSGGVFGTARLLFASGIGPSDMIKMVEASTQASLLPNSSQYINLPVGYHVSDNPSINLVFTHPNVDDYENWQTIWTSPRPGDAAAYVANKTGPFAASSPRFNFWKKLSGPDGVSRWMQGTSRPGGWPSTNLPFNETAVFTITFYLSLGVTSRGRIGINSDLKGMPIVQPWFQDPIDKAVLIQGISDAIANLTDNLPGVIQITPDNTTNLQDFVDNYDKPSMGSNHWVGSTRIGTNSSNSVVDKNCKVWNTKNLFVLDAGIIPAQPMSNTHAAVMTVAEMGVSRILGLAGGP